MPFLHTEDLCCKALGQILFVEHHPLSHCNCFKTVEIWGIEPQTFHMQSERSTTELYPRCEGLKKPSFPQTFPLTNALYRL